MMLCHTIQYEVQIRAKDEFDGLWSDWSDTVYAVTWTGNKVHSIFFYTVIIVLIYLNIVLLLVSKKIKYHEKGQYFLSLISENETHLLYRFIAE